MIPNTASTLILNISSTLLIMILIYSPKRVLGVIDNGSDTNQVSFVAYQIGIIHIWTVPFSKSRGRPLSGYVHLVKKERMTSLIYNCIYSS